MIAGILELVTPVSVASSALLGAMIGALYGYEIAPTVRPRYPVTLWTIGLAFIALITIVTLMTVDVTDPNRSLAFAVGRSILWTITCAAIPGGRWLRGRLPHR